MKKLMSLLVAMVMVLGLATPVNAATITINNKKEGHTYEAYQIFSSDLDDTESVLSNIQWGSSVVNKADLPEASTIAARLDQEYTGADKLTVDDLLDMITLGNPVATDNTVEGEKYELTGLDTGYYLVKDKDGSLGGEHDAYTKYIVKVVKDVDVDPKNAYPSVDKQVQDEVADMDVDSDDELGWGETADHDINETFKFRLIATLPADVDFDAYDEYKVVFTDTMSDSITFEEILSVSVDGEDITDYVCTATEGQAGGSWTLTIENIKIDGVDLTDGAEIVVEYNAHLNENAKIANDPENKNTVYLEYSNNPNAGGENEFGKTPEDHVWVFTYTVNGTKVDGSLKDEEGNYTTPLKDAEFVFYKGEGANKQYVILDGNNKVFGWTADESKATVIKTPANGQFAIIGLDAGTYYLEEKVAPDGYNLLTEPKVVTITAAHKELSATAAETLHGTENPNLNVTVENFSGSTLPETGGVGTTLFYVFGSTLVLGAVVLLVTKKRMGTK